MQRRRERQRTKGNGFTCDGLRDACAPPPRLLRSSPRTKEDPPHVRTPPPGRLPPLSPRVITHLRSTLT